ncbi:MAG: hypothetical protein JWP12_3798 [Bacteroidetes bacterium]|nr:hypothetical protein [Bacteroidota bacterium]
MFAKKRLIHLYLRFMTRILIFFSLFIYTLSGFAQNVPIGGWEEHLCYKSGLSVSEGNGKVYCATTSGIFILNKADNSMERLSKISGLSDVEATVVNFNANNNKLLIAYKNSNIDILSNNSITNISDIKRKPIIGNKSINNIYFVNNYAYLACGFGIVVIDMDRLEVKDTYYIGPLGNAINVTDITSDGTYFYASTSGGIYKGLMSNPNLANYLSWTKMAMPGINTNRIYNTITCFSGKLYTNYSKFVTNGTMYQDTLFSYDIASDAWAKYNVGIAATTYKVDTKYSELIIVQEGGVSTTGGYFSNYFSAFSRPKSAVIDGSHNVWIADTGFGLVAWKPSSGFEYNYPNGPSSPNISAMCLSDKSLWIAPGGKSTYFVDGLYNYSNSEWRDPSGNYPLVHMDTMYDFLDIKTDPKNSKITYASSWDKGVLELYNGVPAQVFNEGNTGGGLMGIHVSGYNPLWVDGLAFDSGDNLWVACSGQTTALSVKTTSGAWHSINMGAVLGFDSDVQQLGKMIVDKNDQKWFIIANNGSGLAVSKVGPTSPVGNASNTKRLTSAPGNGALPSLEVSAIAEDNDGEIWIGTDQGIAVFYSPENVFTGANFDAQQILLTQDGHVQILLQTETVTAIAVDDANRKWIGTSKSGVFLMSPDGTTQISHYDQDNSPLLSNNVKSIVIDHATGEVYFGTDKGLISYRGTATEGLETFGDVYSFPNPVKPGYDGPIAIKGLVTNTTVKITDISGSLVFETKSEGGQAIWYGTNFSGQRVSSGVYMVFCTNEDGSQKLATKILLVN